MSEQNEFQNPISASEQPAGPDRKRPSLFLDKYFLPVSILVAGLLVAGASMYNTKVALENSSAGSIKSGGVIAQQQAPAGGNQGTAPTAPTLAPDDSKPVQVPDRADQPVIGKKDAKVRIVEFADFQCPFCERFYKESYAQIKSKYVDTGKAKIIFRHFPLSFHQNAQKSAEAAECANRQGKFLEYHDLLFNNSQSDGTGLNLPDLKKYADQLGLNKGTLGFGKNRFNDCLDKGEAVDVVNKDIAEGTASGVAGTPSFFINGKKVVGAQPYSVFETAIEAALK